MYSILVKDNSLPVVISSNSSDYAVMLASGYSVEFEGSKRECENKAQEYLDTILD